MENKQSPLGDSPIYGVNEGMKVGGPSVAMKTTCHQLIIQCSAQDSNIRKFERTSARAKHGFQCEKATIQHHGSDSMAKGQKAAMPSGITTGLLDLSLQ